MGCQNVIVFLVATFGVAAGAVCPTDPAELFRTNPGLSVVYECGGESESRLCDEPDAPQCRRVPIASGLKLLNSIQSGLPQKKVLAAYLAAMNFSEPVHVRSLLSIQTGKYAQVNASRQALNAKCMTAIVQAAYKLHVVFPDYNFVVDSHIQNCENLKEGIKRLLADRTKVRRNLNQFHSPLHSVYLSNRTGFNQNELGKMGLYINVDQAGEIQRLLIDPLKISQI